MDNRQIDILVAQYVMGLVDEDINRRTMVRSDLPHYSTDIAAVWQVVEKLSKDGMKFSLSSFYQKDIWYASFLLVNGTSVIEAKANMFSLAICLAALKTVGIEVN